MAQIYQHFRCSEKKWTVFGIAGFVTGPKVCSEENKNWTIGSGY